MWAKAGRLLAAVLLGTVVARASEVRAQTAHQAEPGAAGAAFANAERALAEGRYDEAERLYRDLARQSPDVAEIHAKLGVTYYQEGKYAEAIPALQRALKLKPALPNLDALLAMSQSELGQHAEALPGLKRAFARGGDPALVRAVGLHLQRAYMGLGRDADAVGVALDLSRRYPDDPEVLYHTGRIFSNYAYLQTMRLQRVAPESVWMHQAAGEANESQGFWDAAIREYEQVLAAAPNRPGLHFRIGRVLLAQAGQAGSDASIADGTSAAAIRAGVTARPDERERRVRARRAAASGRRARTGGRIIRRGSAFRSRVLRRARGSRAYPDDTESRERGRPTARTSDDARSKLRRGVLPPLAGIWRHRQCRRPAASARDLPPAAGPEARRRSVVGRRAAGRDQTGAAGRARRRLTAAGRGPRITRNTRTRGTRGVAGARVFVVRSSERKCGKEFL